MEHFDDALDLVVLQGRAAGQGVSAVEEPLRLTLDEVTTGGEDRLQVHGLPQATRLDFLARELGYELCWTHLSDGRVQHDARKPTAVLVVTATVLVITTTVFVVLVLFVAPEESHARHIRQF